MFNTRILVGAIAAFGVLETAYLTGAEFLGKAAEICPTSGCKEVLESPYSQVFGIPLTLFGFIAYATVMILAFSPWLKKGKQRQSLQDQHWLWLVGITTVMVISSSYLMYVMIFKIQGICPYCVISASLSLTLWLLTLMGHRWSNWRPVLLITLVTGVLTFTGVFSVYANVNYVNSTQAEIKENPSTEEGVSPPITTESGPAEMALAKHLQAIDAKMYASYTCPHCYEQKQLFGKEAFPLIHYIECNPRGKNPQTELCSEAGIEGVPTWEIANQLFPGVQSLERLAELSGYSGDRNFIHPFPY